MKSAWIRRPVMGLAVLLMAVVLTVASPLWLVVTVLVDAVRGRWRLPLARFVAFGTFWAWLETSGIAIALFFVLTGRGRSVKAHYKLQKWWTRSMVQALGFTVGLKITVEGAQGIGNGPVIALCRHASLADSIMSAWVVATHCNLNPRYVLKKN